MWPALTDAVRRCVCEPDPLRARGRFFILPYANARKRLVRAEGLEPPQLSSLEPKSSASTNSATPAVIASNPAAMPRAAAYSTSLSVRSKKMALFEAVCQPDGRWTSMVKNGPHRTYGKADPRPEPTPDVVRNGC